MNQESTASFLDKTDWRMTIHRKLEACLDAIGSTEFMNAVDITVEAIRAEYPGWNAEKEVGEEVEKLRKLYDAYSNWWFKNNPTKRRTQKYLFKKKIMYEFHKDVYRFIKNLVAKKRMLLWGMKQIPTGYSDGS
jgi:hypothetical protein